MIEKWVGWDGLLILFTLSGLDFPLYIENRIEKSKASTKGVNKNDILSPLVVVVVVFPSYSRSLYVQETVSSTQNKTWRIRPVFAYVVSNVRCMLCKSQQK